jgi:hypothetical protein
MSREKTFRQDIEIPICKEEADGDDIKSEYQSAEENSLPFPRVDKQSTLNRTSLLDISSKPADNWYDLKEKYLNIEKKLKNQNPTFNNSNNNNTSRSEKSNIGKLLDMIRSTPTRTKNFLGVLENENKTQLKKSTELDETEDNTRFKQLKKVNSSQNGANKTLNNWNERTFRVLNNNLIFGGKIKESKIEKYLENLDERNVDVTDPFAFYKMNGSSLDIGKNNTITIKKVARDGFKKVFKVCFFICFISKIKELY